MKCTLCLFLKSIHNNPYQFTTAVLYIVSIFRKKHVQSRVWYKLDQNSGSLYEYEINIGWFSFSVCAACVSIKYMRAYAFVIGKNLINREQWCRMCQKKNRYFPTSRKEKKLLKIRGIKEADMLFCKHEYPEFEWKQSKRKKKKKKKDRERRFWQ